MTNTQHTESGERLSFYKLFSDKNYTIEIPIIQRDYAQGRYTNTDLRDNFLEALKKYLDESKPNRDLDFIYGSLLNGTINKTTRFIPLDGQQRLTTLFLLHWYLANKEQQLHQFQEVFVETEVEHKLKSKFTYETRTSAREFCDSLVAAEIDLKKLEQPDKDKNNKLSKTIKNQQWYFLSWKNDPTIQGMLVMLDAIHEKFKDEEKLYYELLTDSENPIITFQFLKLEEFGLTDDLYIKMNARGKPLSSFENFKAKFEQQIKQPEYNTRDYWLGLNSHKRKVTFHEYFSHKIDTDWANLFWAYAKEGLENSKQYEKREKLIPFDDIIMNLFKTFAVNQMAVQVDSEKKVRDLIKTNSNELTFNQFEQHQSLNINSAIGLVKLLDILQNVNEKAKQFTPDFYYYDENILEKFLKGEFKTAAYEERIQFHAYCEYLIRWMTIDESFQAEGLKNWMRVISNLTENTGPYNNEKEFLNSIKGINEMLGGSNNIHDFLIIYKSINGFDPAQVQEEILKACLIEKSIEWKDLIYVAEQHGYFKGQIGFLLRLCGIEDHYRELLNCDWDEKQDIILRQIFTDYFEKACKIFDNSGLRIELSKNGDFLWERALLSIGDFLIWEGSNQSFLINKDRDISWKRLLKGDKSTSHNGLIKNVFDALDANNIKNSLELLISNHQVNDWRYAFIEMPEILNYLEGKRYIRLYSAHGIVLFKKERMTSAHAELFSLKFFYSYFQNNPIEPFKYTDYYHATGADWNNFPCAYMELNGVKKYTIDVRFINGEYEIRFFNKSSNGIQNEVLQVMSEMEMDESRKYNDKSYLVTCQTDADTIEFINILCGELQKIPL
ncbi:MAG: DUF262 domain-containing protein [Prolixibacteraceae bacterium]|nr:DUF262 domain-containing protein [Prolixibacteraceae bacterium]